MSIRCDAVFKGCTRPAMFLGVPVTPLVTVVLAIALTSIWINTLLILLTIPVVLMMRWMVKSDDQHFRLLGLKLYCRVLPHFNHNRRCWKASSYSPLVHHTRKR